MYRVPEIKICGITTLEEIKIINQLPIDYIGFVFAKSKRQVNLIQAKRLQHYLREDIKTVGVFVNENLSLVNKASEVLSLDVIQLHGTETRGYIKQIKGTVWQSTAATSKLNQKLLFKDEKIKGYLFDGQNPGTGKTFNWNFIQTIDLQEKLILAGGLTDKNVKVAIKKVKPDVVDVSSGVEKNNKKNYDLIRQFVRSVKND
jgi:phosphoribosylanthranilate isomerase